MVTIGNDWDILLKEEFTKPYYQKLRLFLAQEYRSQTIYPDMYDIFNALKYTAFQDVKVVLLGQDPYHGEHQAHGLCFSVKKGIAPPPSLCNIFEELHRELGCTIPMHLILESSHPSPYSVDYGFRGCGHFVKANTFLMQNGLTPIDWQIR